MIKVDETNDIVDLYYNLGYLDALVENGIISTDKAIEIISPYSQM